MLFGITRTVSLIYNTRFVFTNRTLKKAKAHMRTASFLVFTFTKEGLKTTKVKSTACASKKIKTNHSTELCAHTH